MTERKRAAPPALTAKTAVLGWNPRWSRKWRPEGPNVAVLPWGSDDRRFACTGLAPYRHVQEASTEQNKATVFIEAVHLIVRDGCDPREVHREFLKLEEYQDGLAEDALWERFPDEEDGA